MFLTTAFAAPRSGMVVPPPESVAACVAGRAAWEVLPAGGLAPAGCVRFCVGALPLVGVSALRSAARVRSLGSAGSAAGVGAGAVGASDGGDGLPGRCAACWTEPVPAESSAWSAAAVTGGASVGR
jgi:hypothetical protein